MDEGYAVISSVKHVGLADSQVLVNGLKMQPTDVLRANMFTAVPGAISGHKHRLVARSLNHQLLPAATLQRNEPECGCLNAVTAGGEQTVVLVNGGFHPFEPVANGRTCPLLHRDLTRLGFDHHMVFKERCSVL